MVRGFLIEPLPSITNTKSTVLSQGAKGGGAGGGELDEGDEGAAGGEGGGGLGGGIGGYEGAEKATVAGRSRAPRIMNSFIVCERNGR